MNTIRVQLKSSSPMPVKVAQCGNTIDVESDSSYDYKILHGEIVAETNRAEGVEESLQKQINGKQDLGYISLDKYLMNPDCGKITDPIELGKLNTYLVNKVSVDTNIYYLTLSDENILIYFCTSTLVRLNQITITRHTGQFQLESIEVGTTYHNLLHNLDYLSSGHTGFAGIEFGTTQEWNSRPNYRPVEGMIVVYTDHSTDAEGRPVYGIKVGDGNAYLINQAFIGGNIEEILREHIDDTTIHITQGEREFWNNKLNLEKPTSPGMEDLLIFNRN